MLLVYATKITPRLSYVFKHICTRILHVPVKFTMAVDEFIVHDSLKLSYAAKPLGQELHIKSTEVLFEQGITDMEFNVQDWDGVKCFFATGSSGELPFDIFAATFVLLSRYEEFLPHVKNAHGQFPASESMAFEHGFLEIPVVDIWATRFKKLLAEYFPDFKWLAHEVKIQALVDVEQAYDMYNLGVLRQLGGFLADLFHLEYTRLLRRIEVSIGLRKDPFDTFSWLINVQKNAGHKFIYFFQVGDYSTFTRNVRYNKRGFRELIKMVGDYASIGLLYSKEATENADQMKVEKKRIEGITNKPSNAVRSNWHTGSFSDTYRNMIQQGAVNDYSMGYPDVLGFRAGTCTPFLFYDLDYESPAPLLIHPVCAQSDVFEAEAKGEQKLNSALDTFFKMADSVKEVGGSFIFSFKNKSFTGKAEDEGQWKQFFRQLVHD